MTTTTITTTIKEDFGFDFVFGGYSNDGKRMINKVADKLDVSQFGAFNGFQNKYVSKEYQEYLAKIVAATFVVGQGTGVNPASLCVRELTPQWDFVDNDGNRFTGNRWEQKYYTGPYFDHRDMVTVYRTDRNSHNDQKCMLIYGVEYLDNNPLHAETMEVWRRATKILDRFNFTQRDQPKKNPEFELLFKPMVWGRNELIDIKFGFRQDLGNDIMAKNSSDRIKILGLVAEQLGMNLMG